MGDVQWVTIPMDDHGHWLWRAANVGAHLQYRVSVDGSVATTLTAPAAAVPAASAVDKED